MPEKKPENIISRIDRRSFLKGMSTAIGTPNSLIAKALVNVEVSGVLSGAEIVDNFVNRARNLPIIKRALQRTGLSEKAIRAIATNRLALLEAQKKRFEQDNPDLVALIEQLGGTFNMPKWAGSAATDLFQALLELSDRGVEYLESEDLGAFRIFKYDLTFPRGSRPDLDLPTSGNVLSPTFSLEVHPNGIYFNRYHPIFSQQREYLADLIIEARSDIGHLREGLLAIQNPQSIYPHSRLLEIDAEFFDTTIKQQIRREERTQKYEIEARAIESSFRRKLLASTAMMPLDRAVGQVPEKVEDRLNPTINLIPAQSEA